MMRLKISLVFSVKLQINVYEKEILLFDFLFTHEISNAKQKEHLVFETEFS